MLRRISILLTTVFCSVSLKRDNVFFVGIYICSNRHGAGQVWDGK